MKAIKYYLVFILMSCSAFSISAAGNLGFDVVTKTLIPLENNVYVRLVDPVKNCTFLGVTKEESNRDKGVVDRLVKGDKRYSFEIFKVNCGQTFFTIKPIHIEIDKAIDAGNKITFPYIDTITGYDK